MAITHTWTVTNLSQINDGSKIVESVEFEVLSSDENISTTTRGMVKLNTVDLIDPIPYENLTEEIVLGWVTELLGPSLGHFETNNTLYIESIVNPPAPKIISEPLPW